MPSDPVREETGGDVLVPVVVSLCDRCLDGEGGECHTPGCALWMNRAPDVAIRSKVEPTVSAPSSKEERGEATAFGLVLAELRDDLTEDEDERPPVEDLAGRIVSQLDCFGLLSGRNLLDALDLIAKHAHLDVAERGIAECERYAIIAEEALKGQPAPSVSQQGTGERCPACGVSKQQVLRKHDEAADLVRRAAPFVNAVAVMADDKGPALAWLADTAGRIEPDEAASAPSQQGGGDDA